jgi:hypothetical protein
MHPLPPWTNNPKSDIKVGWFVTLSLHSIAKGERMVMKVPNTYTGESRYLIDGGIYVNWEQIETWRPPNMSTAKYLGLNE